MKFTIHHTPLPDLVVLEHERFGDARGFFTETFRLAEFQDLGMPAFVQENHSRSSRRVLRGLHYQIHPEPLAKLVRCIQGSIFDVAVDIRRGSKTYGQWYGLDLKEDDSLTFYVPAGFAHGFCVTSDSADVFYKQSAYWSPEHERSIRYDDPEIGIRWPTDQPQVSERDENAPALADAENNFD